MNYTSPHDYMNEFLNSDYNTAVFDSSTYLRLYENDNSLAIAPIPTQSGQETTLLDGWMWVLIATNADEQAAAIRYVNWMMEPERQSEFAQAIYEIPSRKTALDLGLTGNVDIAPYLAMLENPVLPISDGDVGSLGRFIQDALGSVITLESTADEASAKVLQELAEQS